MGSSRGTDIKGLNTFSIVQFITDLFQLLSKYGFHRERLIQFFLATSAAHLPQMSSFADVVHFHKDFLGVKGSALDQLVVLIPARPLLHFLTCCGSICKTRQFWFPYTIK